MKKLLLLPILAALFLLMPAQEAQAQTAFQLGPRLTLDVGDISDAFGGDFAIGADVRVDPASFPVKGSGAFDFYFADDDVTVFTVDLNVVYPFGIENEVFTPYAGGGIGITRVSIDIDTGFGTFSGDDTDIGLNLVGGAEFNLESNVTPFAQAQFTVGGDVDRFGITGGVLFSL